MWPRALGLVLAVFLVAVSLAAVQPLRAVEGPIIDIPAPPAAVADDGVNRAPPAAPAKPMAIEFTWETYRSVVVIGEGVGQLRPAWVTTYEEPLTGRGLHMVNPLLRLFGYQAPVPAEKLVVAYRAQAYLDGTGRVHLDARRAVISGPQADQWSPDSFIFTLPDRVETVDDNASANVGRIERVVLPGTAPALYQSLLTKVQVVVGDGI
jgi:hypothetical protein